MAILRINNYIIKTPLIDILNHLKVTLLNGKLKDVEPSLDGTDIKLTCPNDEHSGGREASPDCHINLRDDIDVPYGYFHCFACGAKGSFVHFVALCFSKSDEFARTWLIKNYGILCEETVVIKHRLNTIQTNKKARYLDKRILNTFQSWHPYLGSRKLSKELCASFQIKYDPATREVLFPCFNKDGDLLMLPKRSIDTKIFYLDEAMEKPVYCLDFILKNNVHSAIVTEGPFDCLTAYQYGFPAIATLGTPAEHQIEQINRSGIDTLYLMFDNDAAGAKFTREVKSKLSKSIIPIVVTLPANKKDINDLTYQEFWECLQKAKNSKKLVV